MNLISTDRVIGRYFGILLPERPGFDLGHPCGIYSGKSWTWTDFLRIFRISFASIISPLFHTSCLQPDVNIVRKTSEISLGIFQHSDAPFAKRKLYFFLKKNRKTYLTINLIQGGLIPCLSTDFLSRVGYMSKYVKRLMIQLEIWCLQEWQESGTM